MMFETREEEVRRKAEEAKREGLIEGLAEGLAKGKAEGKAEGILEARERTALGMLRKGLSAEDVAEILSLTIEAVRDIAKRNGIELP